MNRPIACLLSLTTLMFVSADNRDASRKGQESLAQLQSYVGSWRGVGQVRRGSTQGAWLEQSEWAWQFNKEGAALKFNSKGAKHFSSGALQATEKKDEYRLIARSVDGKQTATYSGSLDEGNKLSLVANKPMEGFPARISLRLVAGGKRLVVLYERRLSSGRFVRLAEVGYTRKGSGFGKGATFVECVVTGGKGTIPVTYQGKTYFVCCGGCRDLFEEDPEAALEEYRERKRAEKKNAR
ncbi:MAG: hypothetical protein IH991_25245 [Planctomycetes bacterium]|nr:hypothetical protein [Planctomycetota bacterium]